VAAKPVIAPTAFEADDQPSAYRFWWVAIVLLSVIAWASAYFLLTFLAALL
jgi:hypothetical protein